MSLFSNKKELIAKADQERIVAAIRSAEAATTGELRVYVESHCAYVDAMDRAKEVFVQLGMHQTVHRNAVIIYLAIEDRQFAIFGDEAIYIHAGGPSFWTAAANQLQQKLASGQVAEGLAICIQQLGNALAHHFPFTESINKNELPDEIVFGK